VEVDEWGQVVLMELLLRYARTMLTRPVWREGAEAKESEGPIEMDKDLELLLESVKPVFQSRNPAVSNDTFSFFRIELLTNEFKVVVAATRVMFYAGPPSYWSSFVHPLLRLLSSSQEVERVVLADLLIITHKHPVRSLGGFILMIFRVKSILLAPLCTLFPSLLTAFRRSHASQERQD